MQKVLVWLPVQPLLRSAQHLPRRLRLVGLEHLARQLQRAEEEAGRRMNMKKMKKKKRKKKKKKKKKKRKPLTKMKRTVMKTKKRK